MDRLSAHFKMYPGWEEDEKILLDLISFCFTMPGNYPPPGNGDRLWFKTKEDVKGMDCYELVFDRDNGMYIAEGAARFNTFMGDRIKDSSTDTISFIREFLKSKELHHLILKEATHNTV